MRLSRIIPPALRLGEVISKEVNAVGTIVVSKFAKKVWRFCHSIRYAPRHTAPASDRSSSLRSRAYLVHAGKAAEEVEEYTR
jgi:hypothetical protein